MPDSFAPVTTWESVVSVAHQAADLITVVTAFFVLVATWESVLSVAR